MAKKTKGGLAAKTKAAVKKHKKDTTDYGRIDLPAGIRNGIAKITKCYFDKYKSGDNEGEYYFRAEGSVVEPKEHDDIKTEGLITSIMIPVCDTTTRAGKETSVEDHVARIMNEMRKLGVETAELGDDELEDAAKTIAEDAPYFKFATSVRKDQDGNPNGAWENWNGQTDYIPDDEEDVEDDTEEDDEEEEDTEESEEDDSDQTSALDLASLADEADDNEDEEAQEAIAEAATALDINPNDYETWKEVVEAIEEAEGSEDSDDDEEEESEDEDEEEEEELEIEKEENYFYKPPKKRKKVLVEVTKVVKSKKLADVETEDGTKYTKVPWSELSYDED